MPVPSKMRDSRGRESTTLMFVTASWLAISVVFVFAGLKNASADGIQEYGIAVSAILLIWLGREWTEKRAQLPPRPPDEPLKL